MAKLSENQEKLYEIMNKTDFCMFVTHDGKSMRSRPMSTILKESGDVYMLSDQRGGKDDEIRRNPDVVLAYSDGSKRFASVSGKARISTDRALIKELWNPGAQAYWPDGPDDPEVYAIIVSPREGEYWEGNGGIISGIKFAYAIATGTVPDQGDNAKIKLKAASAR